MIRVLIIMSLIVCLAFSAFALIGLWSAPVLAVLASVAPTMTLALRVVGTVAVLMFAGLILLILRESQ